MADLKATMADLKATTAHHKVIHSKSMYNNLSSRRVEEVMVAWHV
jgi:hypothetical protein